jgi:hypothetical protein
MVSTPMDSQVSQLALVGFFTKCSACSYSDFMILASTSGVKAGLSRHLKSASGQVLLTRMPVFSVSQA